MSDPSRLGDGSRDQICSLYQKDIGFPHHTGKPYTPDIQQILVSYIILAVLGSRYQANIGYMLPISFVYKTDMGCMHHITLPRLEGKTHTALSVIELRHIYTWRKFVHPREDVCIVNIQ